MNDTRGPICCDAEKVEALHAGSGGRTPVVAGSSYAINRVDPAGKRWEDRKTLGGAVALALTSNMAVAAANVPPREGKASACGVRPEGRQRGVAAGPARPAAPRGSGRGRRGARDRVRWQAGALCATERRRADGGKAAKPQSGHPQGDGDDARSDGARVRSCGGDAGFHTCCGQTAPESVALIDFDRGQRPDDTSNVSLALVDGKTQYEGGYSLKVRATDRPVGRRDLPRAGGLVVLQAGRVHSLQYRTRRSRSISSCARRRLTVKRVSPRSARHVSKGFSEPQLTDAGFKDDSGEGRAMNLAKVISGTSASRPRRRSRCSSATCDWSRREGLRQDTTGPCDNGPHRLPPGRSPEAAGTERRSRRGGGRKDWILTEPGTLVRLSARAGQLDGLHTLLIVVDNPLEDFVKGHLTVADSQTPAAPRCTRARSS